MNKPKPDSVPRPRISIVMPVLNEVENLEQVYKKLCETLVGDTDFEWLLVDDGSTDGSREAIRDLAGRDARVKFIFFARNFGHQNAIRAGLLEVAGDCAIVMDSDLQHPIDLLPKIISLWRGDRAGDAEIVLTKRLADKSQGWFKNFTSKYYSLLLNYLTDTEVIVGLADFYLVDRKVIEVIRTHDEANLYMRGLIPSLGFSRAMIEYEPLRRVSGESKYSLGAMMRLGRNGVLGLTLRPLRLATILALFISLLTLFYTMFALFSYFFIGSNFPGWTSVIIVVSVIGAMQLFVLGVIGEYLGRVLETTRKRPHYIVDERNFERVEF